VFLAAGLGEEAGEERCIEEGGCVQAVGVNSTLAAVVVVEEELCTPASAVSSSLVEGCVGVVRNMYALDPRNAKHCRDHCVFCCVCFPPLNHRHQRVVGYEDLGACSHLESFQMPMLQCRRQRPEEARRHFHWQR
jgi:hypothetical protein